MAFAAATRAPKSLPCSAPPPSRSPYDWTAVPPFLREHIPLPPFPVDHLTNSLRHLAELVQQALANGVSARARRAHGEPPPAGAFSMSSTST